MSRCTLPPSRWYCTREQGHDGPCAAWPDQPDDAFELLRDIVQHWDAGDLDHDYDALSSAIDSAREYVHANGTLSGEHRHPRSDAPDADTDEYPNRKR